MSAEHSDIITLKEYFDIRYQAMERAVDKASASMEKRLEGMNEFRSQLKEQASRFITREEMQATFKSMSEDIKSLNQSRAVLEGKASQNSVVGAFIFSAIGLLMGIIGIVISVIR